ncbi:MAG: hypothetical protein GKR90_14245 [Pseudomonadales bacterium]|nr:hypothetical protein [Pseudomonadales bacterium]
MARTERTVCDPNRHANPHCGLSATIEAGRIIGVDILRKFKPKEFPQIPARGNLISASLPLSH